MPSKKVRLFIVEGDTDETAFGLLLERLIQSNLIDFDVFRSDIFGHVRLGAGEDKIMREPNILKRVDKVVSEHIDREVYDWKDLEDIVLLTDTDGCFIDNSLVVEDPSIEAVEYHHDSIVVPIGSTVRMRNNERSANIMRVVGRGKLRKRGREMPVTVYYLSRNLEHALHGEGGNLSTKRKVRLAREFASRYKADPNRFVTFLRDDLACPGDYGQSWEYIQQGTHSLERGSNLHLLFEP